METFHLMRFGVWIFLMHLPHSSEATAIFHECLTDVDCSESNFCDVSQFICEICLPCPSLLNRAFGVEKCAKSEEDCGRCLGGYQSEDLTEQRRSYKCFPILDKQAEFLSNPASLMTWNEFITLAAAVMVLAAMLVVFTTYYVKSRSSIPRQTDGNRKRISSQIDNLPPPYNEMLSSDQTYSFATLEQSEQLNQATPIGRYHMVHREDDTPPDDSELNADLLSEGESIRGSTETIPSSWEPSGTTNLLHDVTMLRQQHPRIVRSQSSATLNMLRESPSRSCPNLSSLVIIGIHRHVLLSNFRRPMSTTGTIVKQQGERNHLQWNDTLPRHSLYHDETGRPQETSSVHDGRALLQSAPEDTAAIQASESTDLLDTSFSRRRVYVEESPVNTKRRHIE